MGSVIPVAVFLFCIFCDLILCFKGSISAHHGEGAEIRVPQWQTQSKEAACNLKCYSVAGSGQSWG